MPKRNKINIEKKKGSKKMKKYKLKIATASVTGVLLFALTAALILPFAIPDNALVSPTESKSSWLPEGCRWLCRVEEEPSGEVWQNNADAIDTQKHESYSATVYLCGVIPLKTVEVAVADTLSVVPGGQAIGISLRPDGILVAAIADVDTPDGQKSPAKAAGIEAGDIIHTINGTRVSKVSEVTEFVQKSKDALSLKGERNKKEMEWTVAPVYDKNGKAKIGLWIRDTVSGIGTLSFFTDSLFGALGHPISDIDTGQFVEAAGGNIYSASIVNVDKGQKGVPGSLCGIFTSKKMGEITQNTDCGVFGTAAGLSGKKVPIGRKKEIKCTKAELWCDIGNGVEHFDVEIVRVMPSADSSKGMVIHITDDSLIERTGGIVQGMSGSPLIQNGKLIGAVTHVFVNDPTRGYGIFIENMLAEAEKIK